MQIMADGGGRSPYIDDMSFLLRRFVSLAVRRAVFDPSVRETAAKAARGAYSEAKLIAGDKDRPRAAGRSVRRILKSLQEPSVDPEPDRFEGDKN